MVYVILVVIERYYYLEIVFSLKLNLLLGIIELMPLKNKALFSPFCMVGKNPSDSSVSFETSFRFRKGVQFLSYFYGKAKV